MKPNEPLPQDHPHRGRALGFGLAWLVAFASVIGLYGEFRKAGTIEILGSTYQAQEAVVLLLLATAISVVLLALDREDRTTRFTGFVVRASLQVPADTSEERAHRLLEKAEASCLITNSLSAPTHLEVEVSVVC